MFLRGGRVLTPGGWVTTDLAAADGLIQAEPADAAAVLDVTGCSVVPGFVDLHVHFAGGANDLPGIAAALGRAGVTRFLATTFASPLADLRAAVAAAAGVPGCEGVHLEGPWLAYDYAGAQPRDALRPPSVDEALDLLAAGPVRLVTLAPELPGALDLIGALTERGVRVSLGHSGCTYDVAAAAVAAGASHVTHAFNAMSPLRHREPGLVGAALDLPGLTVEVIADGEHVHPAAVRALWRARGPAGVAFVSDCVDGCGLPLVRDGGVLRRTDGTLAGSASLLDTAVRNAVSWGIPLADAVTMAATTPARALGRPGVIVPGAPADLVVLDDALHVVHTIVAGVLL